MDKIKHNPQAFPSDENETYYKESGMTLLDYFAGQALPSMVAGEGATMVAKRDSRYNEKNFKEVVSANAYEFAEAMLAERKKRVT